MPNSIHTLCYEYKIKSIIRGDRNYWQKQFNSFLIISNTHGLWYLLDTASKRRKYREWVVACWSWSLCSNCQELKIVQKILSRATMETGLDRRHSSIISTLHTPSTFVHIPSSFLILSHISNLTILSRSIASNRT